MSSKPARTFSLLARTVFVSVALPAAIALGFWDSYRHADMARTEVTRSGYREFSTQSALFPRCPLGRHTTYFAAHHGPSHQRPQGFVCTSHFARPYLRELPSSAVNFDIDM